MLRQQVAVGRVAAQSRMVLLPFQSANAVWPVPVSDPLDRGAANEPCVPKSNGCPEEVLS